MDYLSNVFFALASTQLLKHSPDGKTASIGTFSGFPGTPNTAPNRVAVDSFGSVYVTETSATPGVVLKFFPDGTNVTVGYISYPGDIAVDSAGTVYVVSFNQLNAIYPDGSNVVLFSLGTFQVTNSFSGVDVDNAGACHQ